MDSSSWPGYAETGGNWQQWNGGGYKGNQRYHDPGSGSATATWQLNGLANGYYEVSTTWVSGATEAKNALYSLYDGSTLVGSVIVDNTAPPAGQTVNGSIFQALATVQVNSGTLQVSVVQATSGQVIADAVRVVPVPAPVEDINWSAGGLSNVPASVAPQAQFNISRSYTISGSALTGPFTIAYYASTDSNFADNNKVLVATETISAPSGLSAGAHTGTSPNLALQRLGSYYIFALLDGGGAVPESSEQNNLTVSSTTVTVALPANTVVFDEFDDSAGVRLQSHTPNLAPAGSTWAEAGNAVYVLSGNGTVQQTASLTDPNGGASALINTGLTDAELILNLHSPPAPNYELIMGAKLRALDASHFYDFEFYRGTGVLGVYSKVPSTSWVDIAIEPFNLQPDTDYTYRIWVKGNQIVGQLGSHLLISNNADPTIVGSLFGLFEHRDASRTASPVYSLFQIYPWNHEPLPDLGARLIDTFGGNGSLASHVPDKAFNNGVWNSVGAMTINSGSVSSNTMNNYAWFDVGQANVITKVTGSISAGNAASYVGALGRKTADGRYLEARFSGNGALTLTQTATDGTVTMLGSNSWVADLNQHTVQLIVQSATYNETIQMLFDNQSVVWYSRPMPYLTQGPGETIQNATSHGFTLGSTQDTVATVEVDLVTW
jgi:hypothetical protein